MTGEKKIIIEQLRHILEYICGYISNCEELPEKNGYYKKTIKLMCEQLENLR